MRRSGAFTLVELLVALAITVILVLVLTSVVAATLGAWSQGRNRLDTYSSARQVLGRLTDELKGTRANPSVSGSKIQFVENSILGAVPSPTPSTAENVFFVAPQPNLAAGDLCIIAYALDHTTHELKRAFRDSQSAFNPSPSPTPRYQVNGYIFGTSDWHVVASGVLDFELRCYSQNDLDTNVDPPAQTWDSTTTDPNMLGKAPRRIVIRLKVVDDRAATQLAALPVGSGPYLAIVQRSARQFFSEVSLPPP